MKKLIYTLTLLIATACTDILEVDPSDQYSDNTFWKTEEHANAALTGCYNALYEGYGGSASWFFETDMITPNGTAYNEANGTRTIALGTHTSATGLVSQRWTSCYGGIGRTNTFLGKVEEVEMEEATKAKMIAEAKFLRAFYYLQLVDVFGGVPLITDSPDPSTQASLPRASQEEVVNQILTDLDDAAAALPDQNAGAAPGRATKGAALALKARVLLYNERWAEAAAAAKEVMELGTYSLYSDYREMFMPANEENSEVIFDVQFSLPQFANNYDHVIKVLNRPAPLKDLVDAYQMVDGQSITESPLYDEEQPYENRDPRLLQTIVCIGYPYNGKITTLENVVTTGFGLKKNTSYPDSVTITEIGQNRSELNPILIRYAEVLLTYAEAQNEAVGPDQSVYDALNQIRQRPTVGMPVIPAGLTKDQMRVAIRHERRIELAFEGLYYSDIRRWKTAEVVNNGPIYNYEGKVIDNRTFNPAKDYLWPVPFDQIDENPNLAQNPNWNN